MAEGDASMYRRMQRSAAILPDVKTNDIPSAVPHATPPDVQPAGLRAHDFLQRQVASIRPRLGLPDLIRAGVDPVTSLRDWQASLRDVLWTILGVDADAVSHATPAWETIETVPGDGFVRHQIRYAGVLGGTGSAFVLVPDAGAHSSVPDSKPFAGIVALHGHGNMLGKELVTGAGAEINGATPEELSELIGRYHSDFGARFARRGYVVITPDALGFGERVADRGTQHHQAMGRVVEYLGYTHTGLRLLDDIRALSILSAWPGVDASRIGAVGLSEGGKRTMFLSAFDERVRTAVVSGYFTTIRQEVEAWNRLGGWDLCNSLPGLLRVADLPEIAAMIAPRPLLIQNGRGDPLYTLEAVVAGFETVSRAYTAAGAPGSVSLDLFDGGHRYVSDGPEAWFDRWLPA